MRNLSTLEVQVIGGGFGQDDDELLEYMKKKEKEKEKDIIDKIGEEIAGTIKKIGGAIESISNASMGLTLPGIQVSVCTGDKTASTPGTNCGTSTGKK
jgi:hypothetical protein